MKWLQKITIYELLLGLLLLFHLLNNIAWISFNSAPLPWDQAGHTMRTLDFVSYFRNFGFLRPFDFLPISPDYPPLVYALIAFPVLIFAKPILVSQVAITIFFLFSLVFLYVYMQSLFHKKSLALLTTFIYSFFPIVFEHSRWFLLETPVVTIMLLLLIFLKCSKDFSHHVYTIFFFIVLGFALLTKWTIVIYLAANLVLVGVGLIRKGIYKDPKNITYMCYGLLLAALIAAPWYLENVHTLLSFTKEYTGPESSDPQILLSWWNVFFYSYIFANFQVTLSLAITFLAGLFLFIRSHSQEKLTILLPIIVIYGVFTVILNKDPRYTIALLPFAAMIMSYFFMRVLYWNRFVGFFFLSMLFAYCLSYYLVLSFRPLEKEFHIAIQTPFKTLDVVNVSNNLAHTTDSRVWPQKQLLRYVDANRSPNPTTRVLCLIDQERFNASNLRLAMREMGLGAMEVGAPPRLLFSNQDQLKEYVQGFAYIVVPKGKIGVEATKNLKVYKQVKKFLDKEKNKIVKDVWYYPLTRKNAAILYKVKSQFP